jgi:enoyl-CoA hydratase
VLEVDERAEVVVLTLAHGKVNALDLELLEAITLAFRDRATEPRPLVLAASGRAFCAGVDLRRILDGGPAYVSAFMPALTEAFLAVFEHPAPVVAAVGGHALAGGCIIAAACDRRLAAPGDATIGVTELLVGVPFPTSAIEILRHAVGTSRAAQLAGTGARLDVTAAHELGLITDLVDDPAGLLGEAVRVAAGLGRVEREAYTLAKTQFRRDFLERIARYRALDDERVNAVWAAPGTAAAIRRYLEALERRPGRGGAS